MPAYEDSAYSASPLPEMTPLEIDARLKSGEPLALLDVREPYEVMISHLDGALHIPMSELSSRWPEIPRNRPVVVFCHHGYRSSQAIRYLAAQGYTNLVNMQGGIDAWARQVDSSIPQY